MKISIFTTYTKPEERCDPWEEAINCYESIADEVVITGKSWPKEFKWEYIGQTFQEGFEKTSGDWSIRMDIDYFFHEKISKILKIYLINTKIILYFRFHNINFLLQIGMT